MKSLWHIAAFWIAWFLLLMFVVAMTGCKTMPITPAQQQISKIISADVLKPEKGDTKISIKEKKAIIDALIAADTEIELMQTAIEKAEQKAASNAIWATRGKYFAAGICLILFLIIIRGIFWILKLFRVIP